MALIDSQTNRLLLCLPLLLYWMSREERSIMVFGTWRAIFSIWGPKCCMPCKLAVLFTLRPCRFLLMGLDEGQTGWKKSGYTRRTTWSHNGYCCPHVDMMAITLRTL